MRALVPVHFDDNRLPQRFWDNVSPEPNSGCWLWTASVNPKGYGKFSYRRENEKRQMHVRAHRYAYECTVGAIATGLMALHRCDTPGCCNPNHIFVGDATDNNRDMIAKGRSRLGVKNKEKTHCHAGHALSGGNVAPHGKNGSNRRCRECTKIRKLDRRLRQK